MYTHPHIGSQIGIQRQRDRRARAEQQRLARQLRHLSRARRAERPEPVLLMVTRLRSILSATH
jgi:hypothetical protein